MDDGKVAGAEAGPRRRPGGRSARVRAAVLRATLDELAAVGYGNLSFESVAHRAGVHKTTLYRHWPGREALVREALLARSEVTVPIPDTGSLGADLIAFAEVGRRQHHHARLRGDRPGRRVRRPNRRRAR